MSFASIGVGLRPPHYSFLEQDPEISVRWFEAISENYMDTEGRPLEVLKKIRGRFPVALHGVGMSLGSSTGLDEKYLFRLKKLVDVVEPFIVSDHLCWTGLTGQPTHDLLPLPFTEEAVSVVVNNIERAQNFLKRPIAIENVSSYISFKHSEMTEWEFTRLIQQKSGCHLLLDINNIYVNSQNHGFDAHEYIEGLPLDQVKQMHLAGHSDMGDFLFDTHSKAVCEEVWQLLKFTKRKMNGNAPALLVEWDEDIPEWPVLEAEAVKAGQTWEQA